MLRIGASDARDTMIPFPTMSFRSWWSYCYSARPLARLRCYSARPSARWSAVVALGSAALVLAACTAVYPELQTPVRSAEGRDVEVAPNELRWLAFKGANVPTETTNDTRMAARITPRL